MDRTKGYQEGSVPADDGTKLFWRRWSPPRETRATIVILHDLKDHGARYTDLAVSSLIRENYGVFALDLRGHGQSGGDRGYLDAFETYIRDLDVFLRHLRKEISTNRPFILGHGIGGTLAALYATTKDRPIRGIAISGAWLKRNISELVLQGFRMADAPSREPPKARFFAVNLDDYSDDRRVVEELRADPLVDDELLPARTALQLVDAIDQVQSKSSEISIPMLILHGEADRVAPVDGAQALYAAAGSRSRLLRIYADCAHDLWHEPEPNQSRIRGDLLAWLNVTA